MQGTIKNEITIKLSLLSLIVMLIIFSVLIYDFRNVQVNHVKEHMGKTINNIAFRINNQNQQMISLLRTMVNYQELSGFGNRTESIDYLFELIEDNPDVLGVAYCYEPNADAKDKEYSKQVKKAVDSQGRFLPYVIGEEPHLTKVVDLDQQFYQQPKKTKELTITDPFNYQGTMMITYSAPIIIDEQFVGIAAIDRSLKGIQSHLQELNFFATADFYLINSNDKLIASSREKLLNRKANNLPKEINSRQTETIQSYDNKFVTSASIKNGGWRVIMAIDKAEALENVNQLTKNMIGLGFLALLLLSFFLYYLIYNSLQTIPLATNFAQKLSKEEFDVSDLDVSDKNEIGQLAKALNKMKDNLSNKIIKINKSKEKLEEEKDKLQKYLNIAEVVFVVLDKERKVKLVNNKGAEILGQSQEEIIGKDAVENFIIKKEKNKTVENLNKLFTGEKEVIRNFETTILTNNGEERIIIWNSIGLKDNNGEVQEVLNSGMDITKRRLLQEELEYNKLKTQFFANLSHEFKTPLNLIFSALQMLDLKDVNESGSNQDRTVRKYTSIIKQNSYRLLRLVNNLVDITKINANSFELSLANYDIVELIQKIILSVADYVENKERRVSFSSDIKREIIACDFFVIERIMLNLISNAVKFSNPGDEIMVNLSKQEDKIIIIVADTGVGIPKSKQELIFKQFRQVNKSFTRNQEGSGIGLSLVKSLIKMHDGEIEVESEVGVGSKFIIKLPVKKMTETDKIATSPEDLFESIEVEFSDIYNE